MWPNFERARVQRLGAAALRSVQKRREVPSKALAITLPEHGLCRARAQEGPEDLAITVPELCLRRAVAHARANSIVSSPAAGFRGGGASIQASFLSERALCCHAALAMHAGAR